MSNDSSVVVKSLIQGLFSNAILYILIIFQMKLHYRLQQEEQLAYVSRS